jgi:hypothetical protein
MPRVANMHQARAFSNGAKSWTGSERERMRESENEIEVYLSLSKKKFIDHQQD